MSLLGVTTVNTRRVSSSCSICWLGPGGGGGLWLGSRSQARAFHIPAPSCPCRVFLAGPILHRHKSPPWPLFSPEGSFPLMSHGVGAMGPCWEQCHPRGDSPAATAPARPEHPLAPRVARSRRVGRLLTSHGSESFPRTAAFCFRIFEILSWVRVSLPACPPRATSARAAAQPCAFSWEMEFGVCRGWKPPFARR